MKNTCIRFLAARIESSDRCLITITRDPNVQVLMYIYNIYPHYIQHGKDKDKIPRKIIYSDCRYRAARSRYHVTMPLFFKPQHFRGKYLRSYIFRQMLLQQRRGFFCIKTL